mmetsp:Transcript_9152/g.14070  ORF Transcript_9152/g.14070 Transcript_9152/m.14070 type:complete len:151 (+) Transcript_9152:114-566(+)
MMLFFRCQCKCILLSFLLFVRVDSFIITNEILSKQRLPSFPDDLHCSAKKDDFSLLKDEAPKRINPSFAMMPSEMTKFATAVSFLFTLIWGVLLKDESLTFRKFDVDFFLALDRILESPISNDNFEAFDAPQITPAQTQIFEALFGFPSL